MMVWRFPQKVVGAKGFELEPFCGRLSPQAKSRAQRGTSAEIMVGAKGFEPSTSWSRTRKSENLKPCGCRTYKPHHPKNPASIGPQSPQRKGGFYDGGN